ncbi:hypothetical protein PHMEG_00027014 [Phytophthora megakarya]|uniref:DDE Tnp4 domain-containing protein n=1 Tax=Phytophthora megakarya TaxID=4795 RepID=A0A225V9W6_9STRA|nr:hypothetical protein PHMEG_00027014 [Phytophthora megakarya]
MQAVCDHRRRFKQTWKVSKFGEKIQEILPVGCHLLGDAEFTLSDELLTPYIPREEGGKLTRRQENYNYIHCSSRMAIECAFGMQRFRLIRRQLELKSVTNSTKCILASMILHNIIFHLDDDTINRKEQEDSNGIVLENEGGDDAKKICRAKRDELANLFAC